MASYDKRDADPSDPKSLEWDHRPEQGIRVKASIFDKEGNLKIFTPESWKDDWVESYTYTQPATAEVDDEIPF